MDTVLSNSSCSGSALLWNLNESPLFHDTLFSIKCCQIAARAVLNPLA